MSDDKAAAGIGNLQRNPAGKVCKQPDQTHTS